MEVLGTLQGEEGNFEEMVIKLEVLVRAIRPQQKGVTSPQFGFTVHALVGR